MRFLTDLNLFGVATFCLFSFFATPYSQAQLNFSGAKAGPDCVNLVLAETALLSPALRFFLKDYKLGEIGRVRLFFRPGKYVKDFNKLDAAGIKYSVGEMSFTNGTGYSVDVKVDSQKISDALLKVIAEMHFDSADLTSYMSFFARNRGFRLLSFQKYLTEELADELSGLLTDLFDGSSLKEKMILQFELAEGDSSGESLQDFMRLLVQQNISIPEPIRGGQRVPKFTAELKNHADVATLELLLHSKGVDVPNISKVPGTK